MDGLLLETGDDLLLETGDRVLLEDGTVGTSPVPIMLHHLVEQGMA